MGDCTARLSLKAVGEHVAPLAGGETYDKDFILDLLLAYGKPQGNRHEAMQRLAELRHRPCNNTVESGNEQLMASGDADIETAGSRRVRGIAASQILVTLLIVNHDLRKIAAFLSDKEIERARATPRVHTIRRRDRVWANRYTKTTGNGDLTIPRGSRTSSLTTTPPDRRDQLALTPMRT